MKKPVYKPVSFGRQLLIMLISVGMGLLTLQLIAGFSLGLFGIARHAFLARLFELVFLLVPLCASVLTFKHLKRTYFGRHAEWPKCSTCGYDCRATPYRCPECGQDPRAL